MYISVVSLGMTIYADCVEGAKEMGVIYGTGVYEKGEVTDKEVMNQAYQMGLQV